MTGKGMRGRHHRHRHDIPPQRVGRADKDKDRIETAAMLSYDTARRAVGNRAFFAGGGGGADGLYGGGVEPAGIGAVLFGANPQWHGSCPTAGFGFLRNLRFPSTRGREAKEYFGIHHSGGAHSQ
jgi:hypothetical protein